MKNIWFSPAKINLFLYIIGMRTDGYHNIQTLFQLLNYGDTIYIIPNKSGHIKLLTRIQNIPNSKNIIIKAAKLLKKKANILKCCSSKLGANIYIKKNIPIGGGMGGGSSNAATTLVALNKLWNINFKKSQIANFGKKLGADVPVFVMGKTSIAEGIGNILHPIKTKKKWYLITYPNIKISTKEIFSHPSLHRNSKKKCIHLLLNTPFKNDCENLITQKFHIIKNLIKWLTQYAPSRITGTGSCVFSEFHSQKDANEILSILPINMYGVVVSSSNTSILHK
ncbi:MAG: 4-(cytidine 5'-diphospho)-2-C-methyl-D-erythritol kinase [Buchnera aphidicola (Schlechtendalia peitan)]